MIPALPPPSLTAEQARKLTPAERRASALAYFAATDPVVEYGGSGKWNLYVGGRTVLEGVDFHTACKKAWKFLHPNFIEHILDDRTRMVAKDNGGYPVKWMIERDGIALLNTRFPTEHHAAEFWEQHSTEYQL